MEVKLTKNHFDIAKEITWEEVVKKISNEFLHNTQRVLMDNPKVGPTIICHNPNLMPHMYQTLEEVQKLYVVKNCHLYVSFAKNSDSFGRHCDNNDVLIVQCLGKVRYKFDNGDIHTLNPGDSVFIPKGVYHDPEILCHRATLSFGVEEK